MFTRRRALLSSLLYLVIASVDGAMVQTHAQQDFPTRPIRLIIPFGAGGIADIHSRIVAERLSDRFGRQVYVENLPGGFGIPAAKAVLSSPPDGHTLALFSNGTATSVSLLKNLTFDPLTDFRPVANVVQFDFLMAVNAGSKYRNLGDFIAAARETPGKLNIGTTARGSSSNLAGELLRLTAGISVTVVPYRNPSELIVALLRNDVDMVLDTHALLKGTIDDKSARALATTGGKRSAALPETPTAAESGLADFEVTSWNGIFVPAGTPPDIVTKLNGAFQEILARPDVKERLMALSLEAYAGTPSELGARLKRDIEKWSGVIAKAGIEKQ